MSADVPLRITTRILRSGSDFAAFWEAIQGLRQSLQAEGDVLLDPLHFLAYTDAIRRSFAVACLRGDDLIGVMFATQHYTKGAATGFAVGGDFVGRGLLLCAPEDEAEVIRAGIERLFAAGIHSLHLRMQPRREQLPEGPAPGRFKIASYDRLIAGDRLLLGQSFEALVASFGRRTRKNIAQHRRMCREAGCEYVSGISREEYADALHRLNALGDFQVAALRMERDQRLLRLHRGLRVGLRSGDGTLIAVICGFFRDGRFYLLTQANDATLSKLSLSTVLRTYLIEQLIEMGIAELQIMGGSSLALGRYFESIAYRSIFVDKAKGPWAVVKRFAAALVRARRAHSKRVPYGLEILAGAFLRQHPGETELHAPPAAEA